MKNMKQMNNMFKLLKLLQRIQGQATKTNKGKLFIVKDDERPAKPHKHGSVK